jgi:galactosyl transferase GMA12/MNN10 family
VRRALATIGTGPMRPALELALRTFRPYARQHGYEVVVGTGGDSGRGPAWAKVVLLRQLLAEHDEVLWVDSDILILDRSEDIADHVPSGCFQALIEQQLPGERAVNTGVWFMRRDPRSLEFLDAVWERDAVGESGMWENAQVLHLLGYTSIRPYQRVKRTRWHDGTVLLDETWNMIRPYQPIKRTRWHDGSGLQSAERFRHYSGMPNQERVHLMRCDLHAISGHRARLLVCRCQRRLYYRRFYQADVTRYNERRVAGDSQP